MPRVYLLTGKPGTGKTSLIKQVAADLKDRAGGFYTEEIRSQGFRLGFRLVTLDGQEAILATSISAVPTGSASMGLISPPSTVSAWLPSTAPPGSQS